MAARELRTDRLLLRGWRDEDLEPFAALNADPEVMAHFPAPLDRAASDAFAARCRAHLEEHGWGLWALEVVGGAGGLRGFVGYVGLSVPTFEAPFAPCTEVGWRLARAAWGHGLATEAAGLALDVAFSELALDEVVAFTSAANLRSRAVMERLGMAHDPDDDFDHPRFPGWEGRRHVLFRLRRPVA